MSSCPATFAPEVAVTSSSLYWQTSKKEIPFISSSRDSQVFSDLFSGYIFSTQLASSCSIILKLVCLISTMQSQSKFWQPLLFYFICYKLFTYFVYFSTVYRNTSYNHENNSFLRNECQNLSSVWHVFWVLLCFFTCFALFSLWLF